jgi:hypothetical protein
MHGRVRVAQVPLRDVLSMKEVGCQVVVIVVLLRRAL